MIHYDYIWFSTCPCSQRHPIKPKVNIQTISLLIRSSASPYPSCSEPLQSVPLTNLPFFAGTIYEKHGWITAMTRLAHMIRKRLKEDPLRPYSFPPLICRTSRLNNVVSRSRWIFHPYHRHPKRWIKNNNVDKWLLHKQMPQKKKLTMYSCMSVCLYACLLVCLPVCMYVCSSMYG